MSKPIDGNFREVVVSAPDENLLVQRIALLEEELEREEEESKSTDRPFRYKVYKVWPAVKYELTKVYIDPDDEETRRYIKRRAAGLKEE